MFLLRKRCIVLYLFHLLSLTNTVFYHLAYTLHDVQKSFILVGPGHSRFTILWKSLQFAQWSAFPINWTQNYGNNYCFSLLLSLQGSFHLNPIAVMGSHKIGSYQ